MMSLKSFIGNKMFRYDQDTGDFFHDELLLAKGYSGFGSGKNNPECECIVSMGPIPVNTYHIGLAFNSVTFGPTVFRLTKLSPGPAPTRDGFLIHGDNKNHTASHGCIILERSAREYIRDSEDSFLEVF